VITCSDVPDLLLITVLLASKSVNMTKFDNKSKL
jgi:hypothetical protein